MKTEHIETKQSDRGEIRLLQYEDELETVDVRLANDTVWLSQAQMQELFSRERSVITKHINNIFKEGELTRGQVCAKFAHTATDQKTYQVEHYNLDVIISVGYRVKSKRGTHFRIWATTILKDHLIKGYTLNQRRLAETGINEAQQVLALLSSTLDRHNLINDEGRLVLDIINRYAKTWQLLLGVWAVMEHKTGLSNNTLTSLLTKSASEPEICLSPPLEINRMNSCQARLNWSALMVKGELYPRM